MTVNANETRTEDWLADRSGVSGGGGGGGGGDGSGDDILAVMSGGEK